MIIFKQAQPLSEYIEEQKNKGKKIGFVPTMGALHDGHLALIQRALQTSDIVVCSIFVNPTQFNNPDDFKHYPITIEKDIEQLVATQCHVLFLPPVDEIYPAGHETLHYDLGALEQILEGSHRPGHFQGVSQVVDRLLQIVRPDELFLGQKDLQQVMVIRRLIELTGKENTIRVIAVPTLREQDGLAMSSRNLRLDPEQRKLAVSISRALDGIRTQVNKQPLAQLSAKARQQLEEKGFRVDYVSIARASDLSPAQDTDAPLVALVAATIGNVRLIDNMPLNQLSADSY